MEDGFQLQDSKITIIGLGLMGGSLALALKGKCAALFGIDADRATLELALEKGIVDRADADPANILSESDLVVLATPVQTILDYIKELPQLIQTPCIVLDLGSTKKEIIQAMSALPGNFDPIGGHPICGREKLGLEQADGRLFDRAAFVLTPLERTSLRARQAAEHIVSAIGATSVEMDANEHDRVLASTSHLPFLISSALALSTPPDYFALVGTGFKSTSRLAGTPAHMMLGVLQTNRENILGAIQTFRESLRELESELEAEDYSRLEHMLDRSRTAYQALYS
ncbi:MAG TPA: prephenate dehydrogenase/arogenate dehydrogenase family protein [Anaerolineales bacterium]|nr:prephenate dehydrogenase/arogenate dehydrogenase family protein [Anaerolineales bacterium]